MSRFQNGSVATRTVSGQLPFRPPVWPRNGNGRFKPLYSGDEENRACRPARQLCPLRRRPPGDRRSEGTRSLCRDHAYDVRIRAQAETKQKQNCKPSVRKSSGNGFTEETECTIQGSTVTSKVVTTFTGDTAVHSETHGTYSPALYGTAETTVIMDQKYIGACPAGMEPGDFMTSDGKITHVKH